MIINFSPAIDILKSGGVVVLPTDTIYGLVACANNRLAVEKVYAIKKRSPLKPCIILIDNPNRILEFGVDKKWLDIAANYWPGPISLILPIKVSNFSYLDRGTKTLAFRVPDNKDLQNLISQCGSIIAPSANPEGLPPAKNIYEAKKYFKNKIDLYVNGGEITNSAPSMIINMSNKQIIR